MRSGLVSSVAYMHSPIHHDTLASPGSGGRAARGSPAASSTGSQRSMSNADVRSAVEAVRASRAAAASRRDPAQAAEPPRSPGGQSTQRLTSLQQAVLKSVRGVGLSQDQFLAVSRAVRLCVWQAAEEAKNDDGGERRVALNEPPD